jgi:hypothetical protein
MLSQRLFRRSDFNNPEQDKNASFVFKTLHSFEKTEEQKQMNKKLSKVGGLLMKTLCERCLKSKSSAFYMGRHLCNECYRICKIETKFRAMISRQLKGYFLSELKIERCNYG